jgi:hypothetical protein
MQRHPGTPGLKGMGMAPSNDGYPRAIDLQHGDLLLPRPPQVEAITSPTEALKDGWDQSLADTEFIEKDSRGHVNLVHYWPLLLRYLRRVVGDEAGYPNDIKALIAKVWSDLGSDFNFEDLKHAILAKQYVGHCAIVDLKCDPNGPWVIESSHTHGGMRCIRFEEWVAERLEGGANVWLYRLSQAAIGGGDFENRRDAFVAQAHRFRQQRIRYAIFDSQTSGAKFSLKKKDVQKPGDATYLYCSELVLKCAALAFGGLDLCEQKSGPPAAQQADFNMFTPKDLSASRYVEFVDGPAGKGPYFRQAGSRATQLMVQK